MNASIIFYFILFYSTFVNLGLFQTLYYCHYFEIFNFWVVGLILMLEWTCEYSNMASTSWHIYQQFIVIEHEKCRTILELWFYSLITSPKDPHFFFPPIF